MVGTIHRCKHCGYICVSGGIKNEQAPNICPRCHKPMDGSLPHNILQSIKDIFTKK